MSVAIESQMAVREAEGRCIHTSCQDECHVKGYSYKLHVLNIKTEVKVLAGALYALKAEQK